MSYLGTGNKYINFFKSDMGIIILFSLVKLFLHLYTNIFAGYGIFRDELYYLSCATRPDLGYVDQPPFSIWVLTVVKTLLGNSVFAIRLAPAFIGSLTLYFSGRITKEMGGGRISIIVTLTAILFAPIYLGMNTYYSMNSIDILLGAVTFFLVTRIMKNNVDKTWILLGMILGLGLLNKIGFLWIGFALFTGFLIFTRGKFLLKKGPWIAAAISSILFLPFVIWNFTHNWAHLEFIRNAQMYKYSGITRIDFLKDIFLILNPVTILIWLPGLFWLLFSRNGKKFRILGFIFITVFLILFINGKSKAEYISAAFIPLFASGGMFYEQMKERKLKRFSLFGIISMVLIMGILLAPFALPILPVDTFIKYSEKIGIKPPSPEGNELTELPQFYADMFGWEEMAANVSKAYNLVPPGEKENTIAWGSNYGRAGAVEYFSSQFPLPKAVSPHNNFWYWGIGDKEIKNVIVIGGRREELLRLFENVHEILTHRAKYVMPYENNLKIFLCSNPTVNLSEVWKNEKHFN